MMPASIALRVNFDMEIAKAKAKYAQSIQASTEMQSKVPLSDETVEDITKNTNAEVQDFMERIFDDVGDDKVRIMGVSWKMLILRFRRLGQKHQRLRRT